MGLVLRVLIALLPVSGAAHSRELAQLGPLRANPGKAVSGHLEVTGVGDPGTRIARQSGAKRSAALA
jgi:hypothetical protein